MTVRAPDVAPSAAVHEATPAVTAPQFAKSVTFGMHGPGWLAWVHELPAKEHARAALSRLACVEESQACWPELSAAARVEAVEAAASLIRLHLAALVELVEGRYVVTAEGKAAASADGHATLSRLMREDGYGLGSL